MNSRKKFKIDTQRERLEKALQALEEIVPDNLRQAAALVRLLDPETAREVSPQLERYADLIDALRRNLPDAPWSPFVEAQFDRDPAIAAQLKEVTHAERVFLNNKYQVTLKVLPRLNDPDPAKALRHLSIKRIDKAAIHDWRDLQRIKNDICGPEAEALELYPAETRLVDTSNQYHLWVIPERIGVGYNERCIMEAEDFGVRQRPFGDPALKQEAAETYQKMLHGTLGGGNDDLLKRYLEVREQKANKNQENQKSEADSYVQRNPLGAGSDQSGHQR